MFLDTPVAFSFTQTSYNRFPVRKAYASPRPSKEKPSIFLRLAHSDVICLEQPKRTSAMVNVL
ncbi:MAG: hypothetical protein QXN83_07920 [Nitrososphaerales archaeon]